MAKLKYTNSDFIEKVKTRMMVPIDQVSYSDANILELASDEVDMELIPDIMSARQEFYVFKESQVMNNSGRYPIPDRAVGEKVRIVYLKTTDDDSAELAPCVRINLEDLPYYSYNNNPVSNGGCFYLENDEVVFPQPTNNSFPANYVEIHFYMRPNQMVSTAACLTVSGIDRDMGIINVLERQIPSTYSAGALIDFIQYKPGNKLRGYEISLTGVSSNININSQKYINLDPSDIPTSLEVGDYVAIQMETPVPQIPADLRAMLEQATVCRILEGQGDLGNLKAAQAKLETYRKRMFNLITDRTEGQPRKVTSKTGLLQSSLIGGYYRKRGW